MSVIETLRNFREHEHITFSEAEDNGTEKINIA
jgi:hypothetical protein